MEGVEAHTMRILETVPAGTMKSATTHFVPGDVLYGRLRPYLNKVVSPRFEGLASAEFIPLTPNEGVATDFVRLRLNSSEFVEFSSRLDEGDRPRVDWPGIRQFRLAIPPTREQERIVEAVESYLSRLDAALASLERVQAKLKAYRASVFRAAVEGRLVPTEAELARQENRYYEPAQVLLDRILKERRRRWEEAELFRIKKAGKSPKDDKWKEKYRAPEVPAPRQLGELPEGWRWAALQSLSTKIVDGVHKKPTYVAEGVPFVTVKNLTAGPGISFDALNYVSESDHREFCRRTNPEYGDILISKDGTLGVIRKVRTNREFSIFVSVALVKPVLEDTSDYLEVALSSSTLQRQMVPKGSGLQHIHLEDLRVDFVPIPPLAEQTRIVDAASRLLAVAEHTEKEIGLQLRRLSRLRQAVFKSAFEGKLVDQDPSDEPAEVLLARIRAAREDAAPKKVRQRKVKAAS